jgi:hypothetical protein
MGGFSYDTHQTEAFTYYCVKCRTGYTYIRPLSSETYEVLRWLNSGTQFELAPESEATAVRYRPALMEKCLTALAAGVADFRKHRHCLPECCPLDSWPMSPPSVSFAIGGTRTANLYYCRRCNHYHCYGTDPDYGWQYLLSVTASVDGSRYVITIQRTTDDIAQECVRAIRSFIASQSS